MLSDTSRGRRFQLAVPHQRRMMLAVMPVPLASTKADEGLASGVDADERPRNFYMRETVVSQMRVFCGTTVVVLVGWSLRQAQ